MKIQVSILFLLLIPFINPLYAQTASEMDSMLTATSVSASMGARFVLGAADLLDAELSGEEAEKEAYELAVSNGWIRVAEDENLTLQDTAFLMMKAFEMKGGVMYSLFETPRLAYREMIYQKLITGHVDGTMKVHGPRFLQILDRVMSYAASEERM